MGWANLRGLREAGWFGRLAINAWWAFTTVVIAIALPAAARGSNVLPMPRDPVGNRSIVWIDRIRRDWQRLVGESPGISLRIPASPNASLIDPFVAFVAAEQQVHPEVSHTIVMPMAIPHHRFDSLLLNQRGINMHQALDASGNRVFTLERLYLPA